MQVFLPETTFSRSAQVLDTKRLVKQLLEGRQIMTVLAGESTSNGWKNHPAVKMFFGYEVTLYSYLVAIRDEMKSRGYKWEKNWAVIEDIYQRHYANDLQATPWWMADKEVFNKIVITHRGRLWEKNSEYYHEYEPEGKVFMNYVCCPENGCTYYWATHKTPLFYLDWSANGEETEEISGTLTTV